MLMYVILVPESLEDFLKFCNIDGKEAPAVTCGEAYNLEVKEAFLDYNVNCGNQLDSNSPCRKDVTSLLENTCDGYSKCIIHWSAIECLEYHCRGKPMDKIEVTFKCVGSMFSLFKLKSYCVY